jgi:REP element-mobilizing transposase RayT
MARGLDGMTIFKDNNDRKRFLELLGKYLGKYENRCYAWVLMPNHYHILVRISASNLGMMMRRINGSYARYFNKKYNRRGYVFMDRYKSIATQEFHYFRQLIRYIHLNPIRSGIVQSIKKLTEYQWCSHIDIISQSRFEWLNKHEVLKRFGADKNTQKKEYLSFLGGDHEQYAGAYDSSDGNEGNVDDRVMGDPVFVRRALKKDQSVRAHRARIKSRGVDLEYVAKKVAVAYNIDAADIRKKRRGCAQSEARSVFTYLAHKTLGVTWAALADWLGMISATGAYLAGNRGAEIIRVSNLNIKI